MPKTILFLAANPKGTSPLRLGEEVRDIDEGLRRSQHRDEFTLTQNLATRPRDIQRAMLDHQPQIVHFSGHGMGEQGLVFEDEVGQPKFVTGAALAALFKLFSQKLECVVLNGCYSQVQAEAIAQHIPYVIGMGQEIGDRAALEFAVGFYDALAAGGTVEFAFDLGCVAIQMAGVAGESVPVLLRKPVEAASASPMPVSPAVPSSTSTPPMSDPQPLSVFISYSHRDEDFKDELVVHLSTLKRQGKIRAWQDRDIEAGAEWNAEIQQQLESAEIILLLITPRFLASDYCYDLEMQRAIQRHNEGTARVIPIIIKPCDWKGTPFEKLQVVPKDAKPVTSWADRDEAFVNVVEGIRRAVSSLQAKK